MTHERNSWSKLSGNETWRWVPGFEDKYEVSDAGHVRSYARGSSGHLLVQRIDQAGYLALRLCRPGDTKFYNVHRLVLWAFDRAPEVDEECRHLDGDRLNNNLDNLCWGTAKENAQDKQAHETQVRGEDSPKAKLTEDQVLEIRERIKAGNGTVVHSALAAEYGVFGGTISAIARGEAWQHVDGPDCSAVPKCKAGPDAICDTETAQAILTEYLGGKTQQQLADKYGISHPTVSYIINRKGTYTDLKGPTVERQHRTGGPKGVTHEEALAIREAYSTSKKATLKSVGKEFSLSYATVHNIVNAKKKWAYLDDSVEASQC